MRAKSVLDWSEENPYQAPPSLWLAETESWPVIGGEGGPGPPPGLGQRVAGYKS